MWKKTTALCELCRIWDTRLCHKTTISAYQILTSQTFEQNSYYVFHKSHRLHSVLKVFALESSDLTYRLNHTQRIT